MTGGAIPPGFVTLNVSVRQLPTSAAGAPEATARTRSPLRILPIETVAVEGPVIMKAEKSNLS